MIERSSGFPQKSPAIFGNPRKMLGNIGLAFGTNFGKSLENRQKHNHQYVYITKKHYS